MRSVDVTVIIPAYNRLWSLPEAVNSCLNEQCDSEIIVIDDGSSDGTWDWLQGLNDARVKPIRQANSGKAAAVNRALSLAQGEFVRFLDSDDWLLQGANDRQLALGRLTGSDVVVAGHKSLDEAAGLLAEHPWPANDDFLSQQLGESGSGHYSAYLFKKAFIADIPHRQEFNFQDDRMFVIEVALKSPKVAIADGFAFVQRFHARPRLVVPESRISAVVAQWQHLQVYRRAETILREAGELTERRQKAIAGIMWDVAHRIAFFSVEDAIPVAAWVMRLDPTFRPPGGGLVARSFRFAGFAATERALAFARAVLRPFR